MIVFSIIILLNLIITIFLVAKIFELKKIIKRYASKNMILIHDINGTLATYHILLQVLKNQNAKNSEYETGRLVHPVLTKDFEEIKYSFERALKKWRE